jgi:hypothetical protein
VRELQMRVPQDELGREREREAANRNLGEREFKSDQQRKRAQSLLTLKHGYSLGAVKRKITETSEQRMVPF